MRNSVWLLAVLIILPLLAKAEDSDPIPVPHAYEALNGLYWKTLQNSNSLDPLTLYSSGFVNGFDYAVVLLQRKLEQDQTLSLDVRESLAHLYFPEEKTPREIKAVVDRFYSEPENQPLPLFVAFTYARYIISGFSPTFCAAYVQEMRQHYPHPVNP